MHIRKPAPAQLSLRSLFVITSVFAFAIVIIVNWEGVWERLKYGTPVDMKDVWLVGLTDDSVMIRVGDKIMTTNPTPALERMMYHAWKNADVKRFDIDVMPVWRNDSGPVKYTVKIGQEYFALRQNQKK